MNCPICRKEVEDDPALTHCPHCGVQMKWAYVGVSSAPQVMKERARASSTIWGPIGAISIMFSIVFFIGAVFAGSYYKSESFGVHPYIFSRTTYPYQQYTFPLGLLGVLTLIVGIVGLVHRAEQKK